MRTGTLPARWISDKSRSRSWHGAKRPFKGPKPRPVAPLELTRPPIVVTEPMMDDIVQDAVLSYAKSDETIQHFTRFGIPMAALGAIQEHFSSTPMRSIRNAWGSILNLWAQECQKGFWDAFASRKELASAYTRQGHEALQRACAQSFLQWLLYHLNQLRQQKRISSKRLIEVQEAFMQLELIRSITDLRVPALAFANARSLTRQIHLHVGPTNSGKTHGALVTLSRARTGMYAGPLRLLAHEVWERMNQGTISPGIPPRACNLRTGEEVRTVDEYAGLVSCTVEMADVTRPYDVAVIDEIQMIADPQRGFAWTHAVLGLPAKELHLCGEASTVPLIQHLAKLCGDDLHVHNYERLTPLHVAPHSLYGDLGKVQRGDCIVAFKRSTIFRLKEQIEARTGLQCALAYGALPPETKSEQAKLFNAGKLDVMVASDAIGMGLNLRIKRVIFDTLSKWNGTETVPLSLSQIKQIAGRAGRYGTSRDASPHGLVLTRHEDEMDILRAALAAPVRSVTHALIQPSKQKLESLSFLLPRSRPKEAVRRGNVLQENSMSSLLEEFHAMADLDAGIFAMSDFVSQQAISALIEHRGCGLLTHAEKETWSNTPVNVRDERAMAWVGNAIEKYARGELVEFEACAKDLGTLEVEEAVTQIAADAEARRKAAKSTQPLAMWVQQDETILHVDTLMLLESLHRSLTIYLWLGFRFPLSFCFRHHVAERKRRTEASIEFCLEVIRIRRAQRLTYLGRGEEAKKLLQKHIENKRR